MKPMVNYIIDLMLRLEFLIFVAAMTAVGILRLYRYVIHEVKSK